VGKRQIAVTLARKAWEYGKRRQAKCPADKTTKASAKDNGR
jgi:hypothetical protein